MRLPFKVSFIEYCIMWLLDIDSSFSNRLPVLPLTPVPAIINFMFQSSIIIFVDVFLIMKNKLDDGMRDSRY